MLCIYTSNTSAWQSDHTPSTHALCKPHNTLNISKHSKKLAVPQCSEFPHNTKPTSPVLWKWMSDFVVSVCIFTVLHADLIMRQYFITAVPYIQHTHSQHMHFTHIHKYASISLSVCMHSTGKCWMMPIWVPWEHVQVIKHSSEPWGWRRMLSKSKTEFHTRFTVSEVWRKQNSRAQCCGRTEPPNGQTCLRLTTQQSHPPPTQTNAGKTGL